MVAARQLRLALSMNGGVSLAVWIGGAVAEIDRVRRGEDPFWSGLLDAAGYDRARPPQVDVMAGASAGGLNAVMLARAIRTHRRFDGFLPLWQRDASIDALVKRPLRAMATDPRSIFRGQFLSQLRDALDEDPRAADDPERLRPPPEHDLAVFVSATLVRANPVLFRDAPGDPIREARSDAYFHVARRGPASRGLDGFAIDDQTEALARIGRSTSSLPFLFEPMSFGRAEFGSKLVNAFQPGRETVEIMDGGVVDNVPIARAIQAIYRSRSSGRVRRVLLYLHPDPGGDDPHHPPQDPPTAIAVARSFAGKRSETIREDIELLRTHNDAVQRRDAEARALLRALLANPAGRPVDGAPAAHELADAAMVAMLIRAAIDPATELQWHAPGAPRLAPIVDVPGGVATSALEADLREALTQGDLLLAWRTGMHIAALQRILYMAQDEDDTVTFAAALPLFDQLRLLCDVVTDVQLARFLTPDPSTGAVERLARSHAELAAMTVPPGLDDDTWRALATWDLAAARPPTGPGTTLADELADRLDAALRAIEAPAGGDVAAAVLRALGGVVTVDAVTAALMPLLAEPVASDQRIEFVRAAGDVRTPGSAAFDDARRRAHRTGRGDRIAGKQLHHLGAFFEQEWRTNDWRWGRLDAVPALVDAIVDDEALRSLVDAGDRGGPIEPPVPADVVAGDDPKSSVKAWLVDERQRQILVEYARESGIDASPDATFAELVEHDWFRTWATQDRRVTALLGSRQLTSTAICGSITATKAVRRGLGMPGKLAVTALRPLLLAVAGVVLAGRWATASLSWTICALAASRTTSPGRGWAIWIAGVTVIVVAALLVEVKIKPIPRWHRVAIPYALAAGGAVLGVFLVTHRGWLSRHRVPLVDLDWQWVMPGIAAAIASFALFFWMRWFACLAVVALVFAAYAWVAYTAEHRVSWWPDGWPFHSMWVCWIVAIVTLPTIVGFLPDSWLRPGSGHHRAANDRP